MWKFVLNIFSCMVKMCKYSKVSNVAVSNCGAMEYLHVRKEAFLINSLFHQTKRTFLVINIERRVFNYQLCVCQTTKFGIIMIVGNIMNE